MIDGTPQDASSDKERDRLVNETGADVPILEIVEIVQAGDIFLVSFDCPLCGDKGLCSPKKPECRCGASFAHWAMKLPTRRRGLRCLAGTRRRIGMRTSTVRRLIQAFGPNCAYCGVDTAEPHVEHIIPLSFGGTNQFANLVLACAPCNLTAGALVFSNFTTKRDYILSRRSSRRANH